MASETAAVHNDQPPSIRTRWFPEQDLDQSKHEAERLDLTFPGFAFGMDCIEEPSQIVDHDAERLDKVISAFSSSTGRLTGVLVHCAAYACTTVEFCTALGRNPISVADCLCDLIKSMITGASILDVAPITAPVHRQQLQQQQADVCFHAGHSISDGTVRKPLSVAFGGCCSATACPDLHRVVISIVYLYVCLLRDGLVLLLNWPVHTAPAPAFHGHHAAQCADGQITFFWMSAETVAED